MKTLDWIMNPPENTIEKTWYNPQTIEKLYDLFKDLVDIYRAETYKGKPRQYSDDQIFNRVMLRVVASEDFQNIPGSYDKKWEDISIILKERAEIDKILQLDPTPEKVIENTRSSTEDKLEPPTPQKNYDLKTLWLPPGDRD